MFKIVIDSLRFLSVRGKISILVSALSQILISLLDVIGVGLIATASILAVNLFRAETPLNVNNQVFEAVIRFTNASSDSIYVLVSAALCLFLAKTFLSAILFRKQLKFLARRDLEVSEKAIEKFLSRKFESELNYTSQEKIVSLSIGSWLATSEVLGNTIVLISELALLTLLTSLIAFVNVQLTCFTIAYFLLVFLVLFRILGRKLLSESAMSTSSGIGQQNLLRSMLVAEREIRIFRREIFFANAYLEQRKRYAISSSNVLFLMYMPKVLLELALVVGVFLLAGYQFNSDDPISSLSTLTLYLAAGMRVLPSLLRLQNAISGIRASIPGSKLFFDFLQEEHVSTSFNANHHVELDSNHGPIGIKLEAISFNYLKDSSFSIQDFSLNVPSGTTCAIIGNSGSGKSTLVDLILGLLKPIKGRITFTSKTRNLGQEECNRIGYIPQNVAIIQGTIRDNVNFGSLFQDHEIWDALSGSGLEEFVRLLPDQLDTLLDEDGVNLSGGQIQRVAIARALVSKPNLLVLDEATSGLDAESHDLVNTVITNLQGQMTLISISHNWSSLKLFDKIVVMDNGNKCFEGTYEEFERNFK